jgi:hypothetical protein
MFSDFECKYKVTLLFFLAIKNSIFHKKYLSVFLNSILGAIPLSVTIFHAKQWHRRIFTAIEAST